MSKHDYEPIHNIKPRAIVTRSNFGLRFMSFATAYVEHHHRHIDDYLIDDFQVVCRSIAATLNLNLFGLETEDVERYVKSMEINIERESEVIIVVHQTIQAYRFHLRREIAKYEKRFED